MKETGLIMSDDHPRLILEGKKTMTRRVIKPQPIWKPQNKHFLYKGWAINPEFLYEKCPYGQVGDRLWVKETLKRKRNDPSMSADYITYVSDYTPVLNPNPNQRGVVLIRPTWQWQKDTLSAMFMPRWASRILLEISEVRVERLQEITEEDAKAEGMQETRTQNVGGQYWCFPLGNFMLVWDSLNAKRGFGWDTNPWVYVISFKEK